MRRKKFCFAVSVILSLESSLICNTQVFLFPRFVRKQGKLLNATAIYTIRNPVIKKSGTFTPSHLCTKEPKQKEMFIFMLLLYVCVCLFFDESLSIWGWFL